MEEVGFDRVGEDAVVEFGKGALEAGLAFNCGKFAEIKIRVLNGFQGSEKLDGGPISEPVGDGKISIVGFEHVSRGNEVSARSAQSRDFCALDFEG